MNSLYTSTDFKDIQQRIDTLTSAAQPLWGKMTVNEMVCHLSDPFRDFLKIRNTKPVVPFFLRPLMKMMLLNEKPFSKNAPTVKPYLQSPKGKGTKKTNFETDKAELKNLLSKFVSVTHNSDLGTHAALGQLNKEEAGLFMWKHLDHHLRQFGC